jgi:hypothetical protein
MGELIEMCPLERFECHGPHEELEKLKAELYPLNC